MKTQTIRLSLVDMNNGQPNEAIRCFRRLLDAFSARVAVANPGIEFHLTHVQPRNLDERVPLDSDLVLSSGGPGSPYDGFEDPWSTGYRKFLDHVATSNGREMGSGPQLMAVCHSFQLSVMHFGLATMRKRETTKFGPQPVYMTAEGMKSELLGEFDDRLFAFEHRNFEAVDLDSAKLASLGGRVLARESREGRTDKGQGLLALEFAPGIVGTQFHPEADRPGVVTWISKPEKAKAFKDAYGDELYERMIKSLDDPTRLARTFALLVPGWLTRRFNHLAARRGLNPIAMPVQNPSEFEQARAA